MNTKDVLNFLVDNEIVQGAMIYSLDENGNVGESKFRNSERLVLLFNNGKKLVIDTICSGSAEDTSLILNIE
jgi:hypothetical protein